METQDYTNIFNLEDRHVWYRRLRELTPTTLQAYQPFPNAKILDVGCGTGGFLNQIQQTWISSWGLDISDYALKYSKMRGLSNLICGSASHLPFKDCH